MKNICIIPARMGSSRFPGKPLYKIMGKGKSLQIAQKKSAEKFIDTFLKEDTVVK